MWKLVGFALLICGTVMCQDGCKSPAVIGPVSNGVITTPYYNYFPEFSYPNNARCRWTIAVPAGKNIKLEWNANFSTEGTYPGSCGLDYINIYSTDRASDAQCSRNLTSLLYGPFCENVPPTLVVAGNATIVEFCTDSSVQGQGFELTFSETDDEPTPPGVFTSAPTQPPVPTGAPPTNCSGLEVTLNEGNNFTAIIESPNHPDKYPSFARCDWTISAPAAVEITSSSFALESCTYDRLDITDGPEDTPLGSFCNNAGPRRLQSYTGLVKMRFVSDQSVEYSGFRLRITLAKCSASQGSCPNAPDSDVCFEPSMLCDENIDCPNGADEYCPSGCGQGKVFPYMSTKADHKIVGGIEVRPHSWPWQVAMLSSSGSQICGGSIIDHYWVMTAAHCCDVYDPSPSNYMIRVGEHDLNGDREPNAITYELSRVINHPNFKASPVLTNDFCLLKTKNPIFFNDDVFPVCLPSLIDPPAGTDCYVTGWGNTRPRSVSFEARMKEIKAREQGLRKSEEKQNRAANALRQVDVKISDQEYCNSKYDGVITRDMICAANPGKDSCQGDSGGPLVCRAQNDPSRWELTGVVSWGEGCARPEIPGIYARTSTILGWIADVIMND